MSDYKDREIEFLQQRVEAIQNHCEKKIAQAMRIIKVLRNGKEKV